MTGAWRRCWNNQKSFVFVVPLMRDKEADVGVVFALQGSGYKISHKRVPRLGLIATWPVSVTTHVRIG
jgi:hypothetical protein